MADTDVDPWRCPECSAMPGALHQYECSMRITGEKWEPVAWKSLPRQTQRVTCECASTPPTYPTYRSEPHLPGCALYSIDARLRALESR